jgi:uncharacterized protein (TIGR02266 family)
MEAAEAGDRWRPVRVDVPALVSFAAESYTVREFALNLSEGGIFLPTDRICEPGTRGTIKFRVTQFESPFTLQAEVVRVVRPGEAPTGQEAGLGIRFLDVDEKNRERLRRLVERVRDGSIVETIRRSIREGDHTILEELRRRPIDQKMMLAVSAQGEEITALIQDGNASVAMRLLENPRLTASHVTRLLGSKALPPRVLDAVRDHRRRWMANEDVRWAFCCHPKASLAAVLDLLPGLPTPRLRRLAEDKLVRREIHDRARSLAARRAAGLLS